MCQSSISTMWRQAGHLLGSGRLHVQSVASCVAVSWSMAVWANLTMKCAKGIDRHL
jgi:hypothetical protein